MSNEEQAQIYGQLTALKQCVAITLAIANNASRNDPQILDGLKDGLIEGIRELIAEGPDSEASTLSAIQEDFDRTVESIFRLAMSMQSSMKQST